jgi:hypothetical protein
MGILKPINRALGLKDSSNKKVQHNLVAKSSLAF